MKTITENHNWTLRRDQWIMVKHIPLYLSTSQLQNRCFRENYEKEVWKDVRTRIPEIGEAKYEP